MMEARSTAETVIVTTAENPPAARAMKEKTIAYYDSLGEANTEATLLRAKERAEALGIRSIVVASTIGSTAVKASEVFKGFSLIVVRHHSGFKGPGSQEMTKENESILAAFGVQIVTAGHALSGIERAIRMKRDTVGPLELMADTLRLFSEGTKVCLEITVMAADAGAIPVDRPVIAIAGTSNGADTALVVQPAHSNNFFDLFVKEIIAKPSERARV